MIFLNLKNRITRVIEFYSDVTKKLDEDGRESNRRHILNSARNFKNLIQLYISTNGYAYDHIFKTIKSILQIMKDLKRLRVGISFDHIGDKHDEIRGKSGIHKNAMNLIEKLKEFGGLNKWINLRNYQIKCCKWLKKKE